MKVYISGKITGDDHWREKFLDAEKVLREKGHTVLTPMMIDIEIDYEDYMEIDFAMIRVSDAIYLLSDWKESPGARREKEYAESLGRLVMQQSLH